MHHTTQLNECAAMPWLIELPKERGVTLKESENCVGVQQSLARVLVLVLVLERLASLLDRGHEQRLAWVALVGTMRWNRMSTRTTRPRLTD